MTKEKINETVREIIVMQLAPTDEQLAALNDDTTWVDLGADSLDQIELVMALEEAFTIEIDDAEAEDCQTVGRAVDAIFSALNDGA